MAESQNKKYLVRVPAGKETNDFQFEELLPAFQKYCSKFSQNNATRIASFTSKLEVPKELSWSELLNDVIEMFRESLEKIEQISSIPTDCDGRFILEEKTYNDYKTLSSLMSNVGPAVWNAWDEMSKIYWKSCIPRMRMLMEESTFSHKP